MTVDGYQLLKMNKLIKNAAAWRAKDYGYTKDEFIEAMEMYEHFGNVNLEDVPAPSPQD